MQSNEDLFLQQVIDFHTLRSNTHIKSVNYFAGLLGHNFPDHDDDKFFEPALTPYAYLNYMAYHPEFQPAPDVVTRWELVKKSHHNTAPHHASAYADVSKMTDLRVTEMVCDWFSANYEQNWIRNQIEFASPLDFYKKSSAARHSFTKHQDELILALIDKLESSMDKSAFMEIWKPLINKSKIQN